MDTSNIANNSTPKNDDDAFVDYVLGDIENDISCASDDWRINYNSDDIMIDTQS